MDASDFVCFILRSTLPTSAPAPSPLAPRLPIPQGPAGAIEPAPCPTRGSASQHKATACFDPAFTQQRGLFREGSEAQQIPRVSLCSRAISIACVGHVTAKRFPLPTSASNPGGRQRPQGLPASSLPSALLQLAYKADGLFTSDRSVSIKGIKGAHFKGRPAGSLLFFAREDERAPQDHLGKAAERCCPLHPSFRHLF